MRKCTHWVPNEYTCKMNRKNVAFKIRIEEELRREFVEVCRAEDMTAAQVVRSFMHDYLERHRQMKQQNLFDSGYESSETKVGLRK